jgi:NDP-4-keto-2,6-dideoxyhexose 3-C-methyltransferase
MYVTERTTCRSCAKKFPMGNLLSLGEQTIVDFLAKSEKGRGKAPLDLVLCDACGLLQLRHTVDADTLYRTFWYRSGVNEQMKVALLDIVDSAQKMVTLQTGDTVGDIGSNDGTLLGLYDDTLQITKVGFEPAKELAEWAQIQVPKSIMVHDYFSKKTSDLITADRKYKILTAIAMFYDLDDPNKFLQDVRDTLADDGLFIVQMNYLALMMRNLAFDNIGHEHLCYYSLTTLKSLFERNGLQIIEVELNSVNGGSLRVYVRKDAGVVQHRWRVSDSVKLTLEEEGEFLTPAAYQSFAERIRATVFSLKGFIVRLRKAGKVVYAYGASTRGSTLLQTIFAGMDVRDVLAGAAERDEKKYGRRMAGLQLEIVPEMLARSQADYFLLLPWHFWDSVSAREYTWMMTGGKFIIPLPLPRVVEMVEREKGLGAWFPQAVSLLEELQGLAR